jgi:hypothetical protein
MSEEAVVKTAQETANNDPAVKAAGVKVHEAAKAFAADSTNEELKKALDAAVHEEATAMSDALIVALLKTEGGRRRRKTRGRKVRSSRKSRR